MNSDGLCARGSRDAEIPSRVDVSVRYWAGARAAAGVERELLVAENVAQLRAAAAAAHPALHDVLPRCSVLVDGLRAEDDTVLLPGTNVEVLPPFAGG